MVDFEALAAPFPPEDIYWRVGSVSAEKKRGMVFAYVDARLVMERLDKVCGPDGWQSVHPHANGKTSCRIGIKCGDEWVWKEDGAGDTDVEGDKGAFSDAFKRAAVKWGIGRYLYALDAPWVEVQQRGRTWVIANSERPRLAALLKGQRAPSAEPVIGALNKTELQKRLREFDTDLRNVSDLGELAGLEESYKHVLDQCRQDLPSWWKTKPGSDVPGISERIEVRRIALQRAEEPAWTP